MNLVEYIFRAARELDLWSSPAILCDDERVSYAQLFQLVRRCGGLIRSLGVRPGERVAIAAHDCPEFIISFLGVASVGAIAVPVSTMLAATELEYILDHCGAKTLVMTGEQALKLQQVRHHLPQLETVLLVEGEADGALNFRRALMEAEEVEIAPVEDEELAFILYTSGSTGQPKGAMHLHRNLPYTVETFCRRILKVEPGDRLFSSSRLFFAYGLGNSLSFPLATGATSILCRERPTPALIAEVFKQSSPTIFFGVPAVFRALLEYLSKGERLDTDSLKFCVSAGEKLPAGIFQEWKRRTGLDILDGIGSTEMLQMFISNTRDDITPGSSGKVVPGYEARLLDQQGLEIIGPGVGQLFVKGLSASPGYWNDAAKTSATMQGSWMRTGDLYRRDETERYWFEGRSDDLFKVKGLWVSPVEVEDALLSCHEVLEAAVVPALDQNGMNTVAAYVVLKPSLSVTEAVGVTSNLQQVKRLKAHAAARLPAYKCPALIYFTDALPRTATGKLQRFKLRDKDEGIDSTAH